jgi:hypothetical protein
MHFVGFGPETILRITSEDHEEEDGKEEVEEEVADEGETGAVED